MGRAILGTWLALGLVLALTFPAPAQRSGARVEEVELLEAGFIAAGGMRHEVAPGAIGGKQGVVRNVRFLRDPPDVTAKLGVSFGAEFVPLGPRRNGTATLRTVWKVPSPGINDPKTGNTLRQFGTDFTARLGTPTYRGYALTESWEVVPGTWILEIWQDDRKLLEQSFSIK